MKNVLRYVSLFLLIALFIPTRTTVADELTLADQGASDYVIVLPENASPVQQSAANELKTVFQQICDVELPVIAETDRALTSSDKIFVIGPGKLSSSLLESIDESAFAYDTICLKRVGNALVFTGHPVRGPLYAVDTFLENKLGCRWWTYNEAYIPKQATVKIDALDLNYTPPLIYRESFYRMAHEGTFAVRSKCNGNSCFIPKELGGHHQYLYFVHSFYHVMPPHKYFLEHPQWYPEIDGVRKVGHPDWAGTPEETKELYTKLAPAQIYDRGTQLCLTNEEMCAEFTKNLINELAKHPDATFVSVSQNDWHGYCTCPECEKVAEEEGSQSGVLLRFVNKVAEEVEKVRPDVFVDTLAYQYTRKPPKVTRPRHNVVVRLCSIECSFSEPLATDPKNETFKQDIEGWRQMADRLFVWDYVTNFSLYLLPFPNYSIWKDNINFFVDHNVIGLFEQGDYHTESGDFTQLRNWVMSKLLWDPTLDQRELMKEFIAGYYAPELVPVFMEYFDTLSNSAQKSGIHIGIFRTSANEWLSPDAMENATRLFNDAEKIATKPQLDNPERYATLLQKVQRERIPLDLVWLQDYATYSLGTDVDAPNTPKDMKALGESFIERIHLNGITCYQEQNSPMDDFLNNLTTPYVNPRPVKPLPEPFASMPKESFADLQDYRMSTLMPQKWTFILDDENASDGRAIMMPNTHYEWAINMNIPVSIKRLQSLSGNQDSKTYKMYVFVRCDADNQEGPAMTMGIYNYTKKENETYREVSVAESLGTEYKAMELPPFEYAPSQQFWMAPTDKPQGLQAVYIDRIIIVRE